MSKKTKKAAKCGSKEMGGMKVINNDLRPMYGYEGAGMLVMPYVEPRVSASLYSTMLDCLRGFNEDMQLVIADNLLDFVCGYSVHFTNIPHVGAILSYLYKRILEEKL